MNASKIAVRDRPEKPLLIFDGDCGFCRFWVARWEAVAPGWFKSEPYQSVSHRYPEIPEQAFQEAVQLIEPNGSVTSGADAVLRILRSAPGWRMIARVVEHVPIALGITRVAYRFVAKHRMFFSRLTHLFWGKNPLPPTFVLARRIFAVALGGVFFAAFASLLMQVVGLYGKRGISPITPLLSQVYEQLGSEAFSRAPTLFWITGSDDKTLMALCVVGIVCSIALILGFAPAASAFLCWVLYLSFCSVGSPFLDFQWDALLLETGLLAAILLPWALRPQWTKISPVSFVGRWLLWWLLFRLMIESGAVKLTSGDPTWRNFTAMQYHYETQPLPLWTAWYAHYSPHWIHWLTTLATFAIEFIAPLAILAPRNLRHAGAWAMILLQVGILVTGNYSFFNWLTVGLCLLLFEDDAWPAVLRNRLLQNASPDHPEYRPSPALRVTSLAVALPIVTLTGAQLVSMIDRTVRWPKWLDEMNLTLAPLRSFNSYGLFAVMTTKRPEIIVEGSNDGQVWHAYEFKWKPGDIKRRPELVAPHQPRLDWQMWFAALGDVRSNPWFVNFMVRLLEGSPDVLALLDWNPFPKEPPKYVRAVLYDYRYSEPGTPSAWWRREEKGLFLPPVSLRGQDFQ